MQYIAAWLAGTGAVAIANLMEDAATAEISRAQLWQWIHNEAHLNDGTPITREYYIQIADEEQASLTKTLPNYKEQLEKARKLLDYLI